MIKLEAVEYLGIGKGGRMTRIELDIALVDYAEANGFGLDSNESRVLNVCYRLVEAKGCDKLSATSIGQTFIADLQRIATSALVWLNDRGVLPSGYGQDPVRSDDGFGFIESHAARRREDAARLSEPTRLSGAAGGVMPGMWGVKV